MAYIRRSWVEINLEKLKKNYNVYQQNAAGKTIIAVIKANAYGHGAVEVAKALMEESCTHFAVSNVEEAIELRKSGVLGEILILGYTPIENAVLLERYDITQALVSEEYAEGLRKTGLKIKCLFAIDTGMNRIGIDASKPEVCERMIRKFYNSSLELKGFFTHLCVADTPSEEAIAFTRMQICEYEELVKRTKNMELTEKHCLNSAGGLWHESEGSDFIRLGIILYGLKPDYSNTLPEGIEPVMEWKSVVSMVKKIEPGETIGYGRTYNVMSSMIVATIPTGYADGYNRLLSNRGFVLINGKKASIVGRVCMDQLMVDVTDIDGVEMGTEVVLVGKSGEYSYTADDMAELLGTIGYEVVCDISKRVGRVYT